jgi:hypothetical protein
MFNPFVNFILVPLFFPSKRSELKSIESNAHLQLRLAILYFFVLLGYSIQTNIWHFTTAFTVQELMFAHPIFERKTNDSFMASSYFSFVMCVALIVFECPPLLLMWCDGLIGVTIVLVFTLLWLIIRPVLYYFFLVMLMMLAVLPLLSFDRLTSLFCLGRITITIVLASQLL